MTSNSHPKSQILAISREITQKLASFSLKITKIRVNNHSQSLRFTQMVKQKITITLDSRKFWSWSITNLKHCTLQTRRLSSLVGWWWTASGGKISIQMTLTMTWTKMIPEQMMICDLGDIRVGFWADFFEALKIR